MEADAEKARDYAKEYREYHGKPEQKKNRAKRNAGRRKLGLKKGDGKEVDHKTPLSKGGGNGDGNLRSVKRATNRKKGDSAESMDRSVAELVVEAALTVLGLRPQPKPSPGDWRKIYDDAKPVKRWRCCSRPVKKSDKNGDTYWGSMCSYKRGREQATVWRKISEGDQRPTEVRIGGKKVKWC